MIWTLFRLDPTARGLWILMLVGLLSGAFFRALAADLPSDLSALSGDARGWLGFSLGIAWFSCLMILFGNNFMTRTSQLLNGLPVPARTLWWVRMISLLCVAVVPIGLAGLITSMRVSTIDGSIEINHFFLLLAAKACASLVLAVFLFQSPQPQLQRIQPSGEIITYVVMMSAILLFSVVLTPASIFPTIVLLAIATVLAIRLHRALPKTFLLHPTEVEESVQAGPTYEKSIDAESVDEGTQIPSKVTSQAASDTDTGVDPGDRWLLHKVLVRSLVNDWRTWIFAPMTFAYALLLGDAYHTGRDPLPNLMFISIWPIVLAYQGVIKIFKVDHLPISRRLLFPYIDRKSVV